MEIRPSFIEKRTRSVPMGECGMGGHTSTGGGGQQKKMAKLGGWTFCKLNLCPQGDCASQLFISQGVSTNLGKTGGPLSSSASGGTRSRRRYPASVPDDEGFWGRDKKGQVTKKISGGTEEETSLATTPRLHEKGRGGVHRRVLVSGEKQNR